ncbi:hypothetical protein EPA93_04600 [Ktedonosporobacter rubrisoli]|uniref:ATP-grasp domain-containing protein n=1 Tax=Ktedonosporobacter rubrisoli TaxID=2509675 RepID=A0A4P6JJL6_KTERU|nr:hypothetical protein [Ktedonosporobacter rubrisoli]QBD75315.1 hypothetical protein EPA93_04600 [Ktedonosporobacter rubrisoli]
MKSSSEDNILGVHDIVEDLQASQAGIPLHRGRVTYDAVILDAKLRQALMTTRSLGRRGKRVAALETTSAMEKSKHVPTFASRWCQQAGIVPAYEQRAEPFLGALRHFLDQYGARVLISASDGTIAVLRKHREEIEKKGTRLALPTEASLAIAIDKNRTLAIAENLGLGVPRGVKITSPGDVKAALKEIGLPAVVKPTESWLWGEGQGSRLTCKLVTTAEEAQRAVNDLTAAGGSVLFQHFLSGRQESISLFYVRGQTYARFAQWTRRAHPPLGESPPIEKASSYPQIPPHRPSA